MSKTLMISNGAYGERAIRMMRRLRRTFVPLNKSDNTAPTAQEVAEALDADPLISAVFLIHCETTSGIVNPLEPIAEAAKARGKLVIVDAMSSFGAIPLDLPAMGIDVMVSSANKCLEGVPGFSYVLCKRDLLEASEGHSHSVCLDLYDQWAYMQKTGQFRYTPPTHVLVAFHQALKEHEKEGGVAGRGKRYRRNRDILRKGMRELGFTPLLSEDEVGPIIQTFLTPRDPRFSFEAFYEGLRIRGFVIYPGKLTERPSFRIGTIGHVDETVMKALLQAVREVLKEMGVKDLAPEEAREVMESSPRSVTVNGRRYNWPDRALVVICCDGSEPAYMETATSKGLMPNLARIVGRGTSVMALSAMPSFTNPNNLSIATGRPPAVHGICGNYLIDPESGEEVMMNDPKWLRAPTIFECFQKAGARVAVVTAKDKLRLLLGKGLIFDGTAVCFSSEHADRATLKDNGIEEVCRLVGMPVPEVYSAGLSEFVFAAGVKLLAQMKPDLMYLSTTDFIQHKYAPGSKGADDFYAMMDRYLGELDRLGASIVLTADHGMKDKHLADGTPDVVYLQTELDHWFGAGKSKVILPITDPYVVHHGALGSFATVYLYGVDSQQAKDKIAALPGIDVVLPHKEGCAQLELPEDRIGDLIVISGGPQATKVIGTSQGRHDLSALKEPLRSHGGLTEQQVPFITNRRLAQTTAPLRNFDAFLVGCNLLRAVAEAAE